VKNALKLPVVYIVRHHLTKSTCTKPELKHTDLNLLIKTELLQIYCSNCNEFYIIILTI